VELTNKKVLTHDDLVKKAASWLRKEHALVITEMAGSGEEADAIGWRAAGVTTLVECKATRSDFLGDKKKWFRREPWRGMGDLRYYMCPWGLIGEDEIPENWGLLWVKNRRVYVQAKADLQEKHDRNEAGLLISLIRRIGRNSPKGVSVSFYTYETKNTATAGVCLNENIKEENNEV
jgi:hypothetical protein